jgi:SAM-dependent methyltransferase
MSGNARCRSCGAKGLYPVVSLGLMPLANAVVPPSRLCEPDRRYPLDLFLCQACGLVQIGESVPPDVMFADYPYFSSMSETMLAHAAALVRRTIAERRLGPSSLVVEVASNDGYLLQYYKRAGIPVLGVEPAETVADAAERERGIPTLRAYFTRELARELKEQGKCADVIHAHNVLAHVPRPRDLMAGFAELLAPEGVVIVEVPYVKELIERLEFDTIYHEHYSYFSVTALAPIFAASGLELVDVERVAIHGGSLRLFASHRSAAKPADRVQALLAEEARWGASEPPFYAAFGRDIACLRDELVRTLKASKAEGKRIAAYGASAKGSILLNYFGIGPELVDFVVDRAAAKQGRYVPGARIPIRPVEALVEEMPDLALLLVWNIADEILAQQARYREQGGKFIIPLPEVRIV